MPYLNSTPRSHSSEYKSVTDETALLSVTLLLCADINVNQYINLYLYLYLYLYKGISIV